MNHFYMAHSKNEEILHSFVPSAKNLVEIKLNKFQEDLFGEIETSRGVISAQLSTDSNGDAEVIPLPPGNKLITKALLMVKI